MKRARLTLSATCFLLTLGAVLPAAAGAGHRFPVDGPHSYGSPYGEDRGSYYHRGQDLPAAEGTALRAPTAGRVAYRQYQADGAGHYLVIHGDDGKDSVIMHMQSTAYVEPGARVRTGQLLGRVGTTGRSTGPHLHFERWTAHWYDGGHDFDPLPALRRWDRPEEPQRLVAERTSAPTALDWAPVHEPDLVGYRVYRRTVDGSYQRIGSSGSSSYTDTTAKANETYYYRVKAVDGTSNESSYSNYATASATSTAAAPYVQTVDNSSSRFSASSSWRTGSFATDRFGDDYRYASPTPDGDPARYRFRVPREGNYTVYAWHPARDSYSSGAPFGVRTTAGTERVRLDERKDGGRWVQLGTFRLAEGDETKVAVSRSTAAPGAIVADAVRIVQR